MAVEFSLLYQLRVPQFYHVHPLHTSVMWDNVIIPVLQTGNWDTKARSCLVLPGLRGSAEWMRHCFSQSVVTLDVGRHRECGKSPGEQIRLHKGHPFANPTWRSHLVEELLVRFSALLHRRNIFYLSSFWLISGIAVACSSSKHYGGRWCKNSIKPFTSTSAG